MQAIYRNESLLSRAYGNYLGLAALLHYVAKVVGLEVGELLVTAGHVELEPGLHKEIRMMLSRHSQDKLLAQAFE
jgi:thymidylate synthase